MPFLYESTGEITRFTNQRDPKARSREVFSFHRSETLQWFFLQGQSLRQRLQTLPPLKVEGLRNCQDDIKQKLEEVLKG